MYFNKMFIFLAFAMLVATIAPGESVLPKKLGKSIVSSRQSFGIELFLEVNID